LQDLLNIRKQIIAGVVCAILVVFSSGCRKKEDPTEPVRTSYAKLSRDTIEQYAIKDEWGELKDYLLEIDGKSLHNDDKIFVLYWMGVSNYFTGARGSAKKYWHKAMSLNPKGHLRKKLSEHLGGDSDFRLDDIVERADEKYMLQLGLFKLKRSASQLMKELSWKRHRVFLDRVQTDKELYWIVWMGPYDYDQANEKKKGLQRQNIRSIVKPTLESN
jgi:hypothetical protein